MEDNTVQVDLKGAVKVVLDNAVVIIAITLFLPKFVYLKSTHLQYRFM